MSSDMCRAAHGLDLRKVQREDMDWLLGTHIKRQYDYLLVHALYLRGVPHYPAGIQ